MPTKDWISAEIKSGVRDLGAKAEYLGSGESIVARQKLEGIDGGAPPGVEPAA
jgi:hypothetical protein